MSGDLKERIEKLLRSLGDSADAVYGELKGRGITGSRSDGSCCPVANLIRTEIAEADGGEWDDEPGAWWVGTGFVRTPEGRVSTPGQVTEFVAVFDDGYDNGEEPHTCVVFPYADIEERDEAAGAER